MDFSPAEQELYDSLKTHADSKDIILNTDEAMLEKIIKGMVKIKEKKGEFYCPCRMPSGDKEEDKKIICPCIYCDDDIEKHGHCHCYLFFAK